MEWKEFLNPLYHSIWYHQSSVICRQFLLKTYVQIYNNIVSVFNLTGSNCWLGDIHINIWFVYEYMIQVPMKKKWSVYNLWEIILVIRLSLSPWGFKLNGKSISSTSKLALKSIPTRKLIARIGYLVLLSIYSSSLESNSFISILFSTYKNLLSSKHLWIWFDFIIASKWWK